VLGIWILKYAPDDEVRDSVAHVSAVDMVQRSFNPEDRAMFAFMFQPVKGTDREFYRDVLHPSIHGDALHITMRVRGQASKRTWVHKCLFHANHVYVHMLLQFAKSDRVPQEFRDYIRDESAKAIRIMGALLEHPDWKGTDEELSEIARPPHYCSYSLIIVSKECGPPARRVDVDSRVHKNGEGIFSSVLRVHRLQVTFIN
jgi:hypothetical protein